MSVTFAPCVVIPCYNHGAMMPRVLARLRPCNLPCIVVDDGSDAPTRRVLEQLAAQDPGLTLIRLTENAGKGAAVIRGLQAAAAAGFSHAVQVDADGILSVLDNQRGRVFQYDKEQNPLCIFGGRGEQQGFFKNATALEKLGSEYLIADADKNSLTVFAPVPYMETVRLALAAYDAGDYEKSAALWEETLRQNGSLTVAYRGIGRARLQQGRYDEAMACLENGGDRYFYSLAVQQVRRQFTRANLWWLLPAAAAAVAAFVWLVKRIKRAILRSAKKEGRRT